MKKNVSKLLAAALVTSAVAVPVSASANSTAATDGVYVFTGTNTGVFYTTEEFSALTPAQLVPLVDDASKLFVYMNGVGVASLSEMNTAGGFTKAIESNGSLGTTDPSKAFTGTFTNKAGESVTVGTPANTEFKVESISAIDATVYKAEADQTLKVQVNGNKEITVQELVDAGYAVSFSANKAVFTGNKTTSTDGVLLADLGTTEEFTYSVTVTKGEESFTSKKTGKVTVVDSSTIKTIDELELQKDGVAQKSTTITLADNTFKVVATKGTNIKGEEVKPVTGVTYESSNKAVALVGTDGTITPVSAGTTTITVKSGTASKTITLTVAEATRVITTVKADVTSVDIVEGGSKDITVEAFDQFGDAIATGDLTVASSKETIATVEKSGSTVTVKGVAKGSTTITIKAGEKTISIPVIVGENKKASYNLELVKGTDLSDDTTIDVAKSKDKAVKVAYNAYNAANQLVGAETLLQKTGDSTGFTYEVVEKSTSGATVAAGTIVGEVTGEQTEITLTAKKAGTVTVNIYEGALKVATQTITVNDSTPTVTGATFIKDAKVTSNSATKVLKVSGLTFTSTASDAKFTATSRTEGKITNGAGDVTYGTYDLVTNLPGTVATVATVADGELALLVEQGNGAAVSGTVTVRIKDNAGKTVTVGAIDVAIAENEAKAEAMVQEWDKYFKFQKTVGVNANGDKSFDGLHDLGFFTDNSGSVALEAVGGKVVAKVTGEVNVNKFAQDGVVETVGGVEKVAIALYSGLETTPHYFDKKAFYFAEKDNDGKWQLREKKVFENITFTTKDAEGNEITIIVDVDLSGLTLSGQ